jgi:sugar/nucleoside kinase (ribokinase family)
MATSDLARVDVLVVGGTFREVIERRDNPPEVRLGGSGITASIAASRMGVTVALASFVGAEDEDAARLLLEHAGVHPYLVIGPGASGTFVYPAEHDDRAPRPLYRPAETSPVELPALASPRVMLLFGTPDFDTPTDPAVVAAARSASVVLWDRQGWLSRTRDASAASALEAEQRFLITNVDEAMDEAIVDARSGAVALPANVNGAVLKDGPRGALVVNPDGSHELVAAYPVEVRNNVGSGDIFAGVLAAEIAAGADLRDAATLGAASTSALLRMGEIVAPPDLRDLATAIARESGAVNWRWPVNTSG